MTQDQLLMAQGADQKARSILMRWVGDAATLTLSPELPILNITRIDMLATGIKSPVGIKLSGADLATLEKLGQEVERIVKPIQGASSVIAERVTGDRDLAGFVNEAKLKVERELVLPTGYAVAWSGQFEYFERAAKRLMWVVPMTLAIIFILLFLTFNRMIPALLIIGTLPFAVVGAIWFLYVLGHNFSIASGVGLIALAGLAAEFGVIMLVYLDDAIARYQKAGQLNTLEDLHHALIDGAVLRVRPKAMTVAFIIAVCAACGLCITASA